MYKIPFFGLSRHYRNLKDELLDATNNALMSGEWMSGPYTKSFEQWLANRTRTRWAVTVHSGTQALEIIARYCAEGYKEAYNTDPVIEVPNISYVATLNAFLTAGWQVELVDTDRNGLGTYNMKIDPNKAVCLVGLYGANPHYGIGWKYRIVDGAQHWLVAEITGNAMAISFDPTKNLPSSGNGGAIVTQDQELYEYALSYRNNGKFLRNELSGTNSRMSEQECAQMLVRTKYIDQWQQRRKEIRYYYLSEFKNLPFDCLTHDYMVHSDQKFVIYSDQRTSLKKYLESKSIEAKIHYEQALSELPIAKNLVRPDLLSTSVMLTRGVLSLPIYPELSDSEVEIVAKEVKNFFTC